MSALPSPEPATEQPVRLSASTEETEVSFEEFLALEDDERSFELVDGHLQERNVGIYESVVAARVSRLLLNFAEDSGLGGLVLDADAVYRCFENETTGRKPDVSYVAAGRVSPAEMRAAYFRIAPDLAIEVTSPSDRARAVRGKERQYLAAGVRMIWKIDPEFREVTVMTPHGTDGPLGATETLRGGDVLPGFEAPIASLFLD